MAQPEAIIVGGGLAGAAAAILLARAGTPVTLVEKEKAPKPKVCGEFLSSAALSVLNRLGVDVFALGAVPLDTMTFSARGRPVAIKLPFGAASLTRERLDETLLDVAQQAGTTVLRGITVKRVQPDGDGFSVSAKDWSARTRAVFVASGKSDLAGRRREKGLHDAMVGLKRYAVPRGNAGQAVHLTLFCGGYCGIQPVEGGRLNVCLAVSSAQLKADGGPDGVFSRLMRSCPQAAELVGPFADASTFAVGRVPYGFVRRRSDGPYYLGDQAAVIASFCGEGMGIALTSGAAAADAFLAGNSAQAYQSAFARAVGLRVRATGLLSRAMCSARWQPIAPLTARIAPGLIRSVASAVRSPV